MANPKHDKNPQPPPKSDEIFKHDRPPDVADPRAKSSGHGKKTADKWNQ